jgi:glycosyltransferase 2 family protein
MKRKSTLRRTLYFLGLGIALPLFGRQVWLSYQSARSGDLVLVQPGYLGLALGLTIAMYFVQATGWMWLMRYLGVRLTLRQCLAGFVTSFLPRYIPGSVWGYVSRSAWLQQTYGVNYATSSLGSFLELGFFLVTTGLITVLATAVLQPHLLAWAALAALALLLGTWFALPQVIRLYVRRLNLTSTSPPPAIDEKWAWAVVGLFIVFWLLYGASISATAVALGQAPTQLIWLTMAAAQSWLVGLLVVFVPAGLGVRETTLAGLLTGQTTMTLQAAASTAVLSRFSLLMAEIVWLIVGLILARLERSQPPPS